MEIFIRLAGVQLGPYTEEQVRQHLSEGLLSLTDPAKPEGADDWVTLAEVLAQLLPPVDELLAATQPINALSRPVPAETSETPKRAPATPPGVTHLPTRRQDSTKESMPSLESAMAKKTNLIGPAAPGVPSPSGKVGSSTVTTSPLAPAQQVGKKTSRAALVKALAQTTAPLPTKPVGSPTRPPSSPVPPISEAPVPTQPDEKKLSQPSLIESLAAKTVPMRSVQAPPAPRSGTLPVTAPLPTKPVGKPASAPPSIVSALTKKLGPMVAPGPAQTTPPTLGLSMEVATTKIPPLDKKTAKTSEALFPVEPDREPSAPSAPAAPRRILPAIIFAWGALALLTLYYVWSPYHAAASLRKALNGGDPARLNAAIDFSAVRASLEEQIQAQLAQSGLPNAARPAVLSMMDRSIDLYVTPEGISGLIKQPDSLVEEGQAPTLSTGVAAKLLLALTNQPVKNEGLASLGDFVLEKDAVLLHLQFEGMGWKLKRIDLRPDLGMPGPSGSAALLLSPVVDTYLDQGNAKSTKGDWDGAIAAFTQVLAIDPRSTVAYNDRGAARQLKGDLDGAVKDYTQALTIDPQMAAAYEGRGNAKAAKNDQNGAIADYTQAIQLDPTRATAYDSRGNAKTNADDLDGAIADYTQAIALDPTLANAYSDRGFARQANGNLDGAISDYTQAVALKPKTAIAYYNRGLARQAQGNLDAAIVDFDRALTIDPKIAGAYYNRGNAKNANHDLDGAIADYTQALALNPKIALAYCNRGLARQAQGDPDGAVADYTHALAIDPKIVLAYYNRALIEAQKNDLDGAIADSSRALDIDPKNAQAYYTRGFAKLTKGNLDGALADLKQFGDLAPKDHNADHARLYLWLIAKAENSKTDADQELSIALENSWNSPADDLVSKTAAFLLGRLNETDYLAAAASPDAKTDQGQHCEAWYFAGMKRLLTGDKKGAVDAFHQSLATGQKDFCEYILAQAELQALEPAPTPPPAAGAAPPKSP